MSRGTILAACLALLVFTIRFHVYAFTTDDAYITFRYARNMARGFGPVYNLGERVEGYTNPLWAYLLGAGAVLGIPAETSARWFGLISGWALVMASVRLAGALAGRTWWVVVPPLGLAVSRDVVIWSDAGLEMGLFTFLILASLTSALDERRRGGRPVSAWLAALAALTRPEGLLWGVVCWVMVGRRQRVGWLVIWLLLLAPQQVFRMTFYHDLVPNTFHLKAGLHLSRGFYYLGEFLRTHPGIPLWAAVAALRRSGPTRVLAAGTVCHLLYVIAVGGDFMEFRFMVPVLVMAGSLLPGVLASLPRAQAFPLAGLALVGMGATSVTGYAERESPYMVETAEELRDAATAWARFGRFLGTIAQHDDLIAVGPAGAIPYYSDLPTLDMLGLNDRWVARHGDPSTAAAGHERVAPAWYLAQRRVVWVVNQPRIEPTPSPSADEISVRMPSGGWMILGTTLNPDSLRALLRSKGFPVAPVDRMQMERAGEDAADRLIGAWERFRRGDTVNASIEAQAILEEARRLGPSWRWLLREAGMLLRRCGAGGEKRWDTITDPVPVRWRDSLAAVKAETERP